jgi:hypothetical protein
VTGFFRDRGLSVALIVLIMFGVSLAQGSISYTMTFSPLRGLLPRDLSAIAAVLVVLRFGLIVLMAGLWLLKWKQAITVDRDR